MFIVFCFKWGFGVNLHVNISLFRITIYFCRGLKFSDLLNEVFQHWMTIKLQMPLYGNRNERKKFLFLNCKSVEMKLCLKLHCSLCVLIIPTNIDAVLFFYLP